MGRHRRSDAGRAGAGSTEGITQKHDDPTERYGPENLYGFAEVLEAEQHATRSRRRKKAATPVRTGLLGVSAAVALGTVAVATGVLPGGSHFTVSGDSGDAQAGGSLPSDSVTGQGGTNGTANDRGPTSTSRSSGRTTTPTASPSASASAPSSSPAIPTQRTSQSPSRTAPGATTANCPWCWGPQQQ